MPTVCIWMSTACCSEGAFFCRGAEASVSMAGRSTVDPSLTVGDLVTTTQEEPYPHLPSVVL